MLKESRECPQNQTTVVKQQVWYLCLAFVMFPVASSRLMARQRLFVQIREENPLRGPELLAC